MYDDTIYIHKLSKLFIFQKMLTMSVRERLL